MKKFFLESFFILLALAVAFGIILFLFTQNLARYDTFKGVISKVPINITSPIYGQILTLSVQDGDTVHKGQELVTIHVLSTNPIPSNGSLYHVKGTRMSIQSPSDGIIGQVAVAPLSTISAEGLIMQLDASSSFFIAILLPQGYAASDYSIFYAVRPSDRFKYSLKLVKQIPTDALATVDPTMSIYRATCRDCQLLFNNNSVVIYAQHKQPQSQLLDWMHSLLSHI